AVEEIAVGTVDLHHVEARALRMTRSGDERFHRRADFLARHRPRREVVPEGRVAGTERLPPALLASDGLSAAPRLVHRGLASRVRELDAGDDALRADEVRHALPGDRMRVGPDARIPRRDASLGRDTTRLDADESCAADRAAAEVNEVPVVRHA